MRSESRVLAGLAAAAAAIASGLQLLEHNWLRGATGLAIVATLCVIAAGWPDRSRRATWLAYVFLAVAFVLLGIRLLGGLVRPA